MEEYSRSTCGLPAALDAMNAKDFLRAKDRARGNAALPNFSKVAQCDPLDTSDDKIFATMKAALLAIEAALPIGSVNTLDRGAWNSRFAEKWRRKVLAVTGPWDLLRCVILLEDSIGEDWIKPEMGHLRTCLPGRWKALEEASASSIALRIILLDRAILYGSVDRKRYKASKSRR